MLSDEERKQRKCEYDQQYRAKNIERKREYDRQYRANNSEKLREKWRKESAKRREKWKKGLVQKPEYMITSRSYMNSYMREYRKNNPEICQKTTKNFYDSNPHYHALYSIAKSLKMKVSELPSELVEAKIAILTVKRKVKELAK